MKKELRFIELAIAAAARTEQEQSAAARIGMRNILVNLANYIRARDEHHLLSVVTVKDKFLRVQNRETNRPVLSVSYMIAGIDVSFSMRAGDDNVQYDNKNAAYLSLIQFVKRFIDRVIDPMLSPPTREAVGNPQSSPAPAVIEP